MRNKLNMPLMARRPMMRWLAGIGLWLMVTIACAQFIDKEDALRIVPKGTVSLEYPNEWDINKLIALSNDGSRLIDAPLNARYIRVWDWENNKVAQRLLLNENAPEKNDGQSRAATVLRSSLGQELALNPDGRMVAACVSINIKTASSSSSLITRVWNPESGAIVVDNIVSPMRHVPGLDQEAILFLNCQSVSFSPDGRYMAVLVSASQYANEVDFNERSANFNPKTGKYKEGKHPVNISGIALFETNTWKLERFFYRLVPQQTFNSRPLFDPDSKTVYAVVFDRAPPNPNWHLLGWDEWGGNRIVRWDIATGAQLEEKDMPQLAESPSVGVWWTALPGGREVWWQNGFKQRLLSDFSARTLDQTEADAEQCRQVPAAEPTFTSDVKSNCAYNWVLTVLNLDTGKLKYLAPFKKNAWSAPVTVERDGWSSSTGRPREQYYSANISPDGAHIVLFRRTHNTKNPLRASSSVEIFSRETLQLEGHYSDDIWIDMEPVFSSDSRYLSIRIHKSRDSVNSAMVFELPTQKK